MKTSESVFIIIVHVYLVLLVLFVRLRFYVKYECVRGTAEALKIWMCEKINLT